MQVSENIRDFVVVENENDMLFGTFMRNNKVDFKLSEDFISKYKDKQPNWGDLGYITYKRTYSRVKEDGKNEEFWETVRRVVEGVYSIQKSHCIRSGLTWRDNKAQKSAQTMFEKIWNFKMSPPGRGLWMMGTDFVKKRGSMALNNCGFVSTEHIEGEAHIPFIFMMDSLMLGVGVGFDTKGADKIMVIPPDEGTFTFVVPDSREGWCQGLALVLKAFFDGKQIPTFDFSEVRPAGEPIKSFGGVASGPEPLDNLYKSVEKLLRGRLFDTLSSTDIVDIMNMIGKCVIAGNVRRSAEIALGEPEDIDYVTMKDHKLFPVECKSHRWASNNSVIVDPTEGFDYTNIADSISFNGEPGIVWLINANKYSRMKDKPDYKDQNAKGVNPCGEQTLESYELCCLVETYPSNHDSYYEYEETLKFAYLYAKTVTLVNTHWNKVNEVMGRNRRIGTSMSGIMEAINRHGRRKFIQWCEDGYEYLKDLDNIYSNWLCVPKSKKITTVKPSGTVSLLAGVSPGIHYPHSEYYIRRIRIAKNSKLIPILRDANYNIEDAETGEPNMFVVDFYIHEKNFERGKKDVSMWEQLMNAADLQKHWSDNQVSITVTFNKDESKHLAYALECFEDKLKSVSFLPLSDHKYNQAPYEEITKEQYEELTSKLKPLNLNSLSEQSRGVLGCDGDYCSIP